MNFSGDFGTDQTIWYPAAGYRYHLDGSLSIVVNYGYYWSATPLGSSASSLYFFDSGDVYPSNDDYRAYGYSVRCLQAAY